MGEQLNDAKSQFNALLSRARSGDADAMRQLQSAGSSYLGLAKDYYASGSSEHAAIFAQVEQAYRSFAGMAGAAEPVVPQVVLDYQKADTALQQAAIKELTALQELLDELEQKAAAERATAEAAANAELAAYQAKAQALQEAAIAELTALQTVLAGLETKAAEQRDEQMAAMKDGFAAVVDAINGAPIVITPVIIPPVEVTPIVPEPPKNGIIQPIRPEPIIELLQQQLTEQRQANERQQQANEQQRRQLVALQEELQRTQALTFSAQRIA